MSTSATATSSVDPSLWWDPFASLLSDLENAPLSSSLPLSLAKKLKENHAWFVDTFSCFKPPNAKSNEALNSQKVKIGSRELIVKPELKEKALHISSYLCLDEVQSYILVERSVQRNEFAIDSVVAEYLHLILLHYYIERQCLLKCTRQILMHALHVGIRSAEENIVRDEALKLIADGLEHKSITVLQGLLYSSHPEQMDVDLFTLWAEETLIEDNLVLDIIFLIYYESLSTCTSEAWKDLCLLYKGILSGSCNFGKLAISNQALKSSYHAKIQLLLILIETLDLENLLQLLHDDIPFRRGASNFSLTDIQEMDALLSSFNVVEIKEVGPLIHAWAVCLRLILSLPETEENNVLMEIDHDGYIRLAFEVASFSYFVEILESDLLKESDGPVAGYRSVLRTFISAFIACYEINLQLEDSTLTLILDFICKVYRGEESLCVQFWDKNSFIDGPIRCLLCNLEGEFPYRTVELVRFLSSLCEGSWPAECVYNFLDKSVGISSLFEITNECLVDSISQVVETHMPLRVPGFDGLVIPSKTHGHVLKFIDGNTALVRWEYEQSGVLVLLLRLAQEMYLESSEEVLLTFDLLSRLVSFNMGVAFSLMDIGNSFYFQAAEMNGLIEKNMWMVEITCHVMRNLSPSPRGAALMSMGFRILSQMLNCAPSQVVASALNANIFEMASKPSMFDVGYDGLSSGSWFVSGKLAKLLLIDSEQNDCDTPLTVSVLDFTMQLLETRLENELVLALVVFSLQYILVNHEYWKYKVRHIRWRITLKVLEVMKKCIISLQFYEKLGVVIRDMLLGDSSVHNALFRLSFTTKQTLENLYVNRHFELFELEGFQLAVDAALDILYILLSKFSKDLPPSLSVFHQAVLSSSTKQVPAVAIASLISYSRDPAIQIAAAKVLSSLLITADYLQLYLSGNVCFALQDDQITDLRHSVKSALLEESDWNEDMFFAIINLLTSAARHQPAFLVAIVFAKEDMEVQLGSTTGVNKPKDEVPGGAPTPMKSSLIDSLMEHIERSDDYINSAPQILLSVVEFLKALWEGAVQYITILEFLKGSEKFWKQLANCIAIVDKLKDSPLEKLSEADIQNVAYKYQCQSAILEIMAYEMFLQKKLLHAESLLKDAPETKRSTGDSGIVERSNYANDSDLKDILMKWCEKSILENLIKSYTSCKYNHEVSYRGKVAASLFMVHVMGKLANGDAGSLSFSLIEQTNVTFKNLSCQPGFSELLAQYSQRGYSEGKELTILVLNDLYYHIHGELEGRKIVSGPFKDLAEFLVGADCLQKYRHIEKDEHFAYAKHALYDLKQLRLDLRMDIWDHSDWKASKETAEIMLNCMQEVNSMIMLARSEFSALKALTTVLILFEDNSLEKKTSARVKIPSELCFSCIDRICNCFRSTVESLSPSFDASEEMLDCLAAQAELLLHFMRSVQSNCSLSVCVVVLQTSCTCLKVLCDLGLSVAGIKRLAKLLLIVLLFAIEFTRGLDKESDDFLEVSNVSLQLLPILCNCITTAEYSAISLSAIDLILRSFLTPRTWFPIIRKHLQLQHVIVILQDKRSLAFVPTILKFLLTLACVRGGAEMLLNAGFFWAIKVVFADLSDGRHSTVDANSNSFITSSNKTEKPQQIWGLGLSVITAMVHSLGESSFCTDIMDNLIPYLFLEKAYLISYHLCAPEFPSEDHNKKRQRAQETQTSLIALKETEHTVMLLCTLAKNWNSWNKTLKEMDSQLGEKTIHLLAFFSRGMHRFGDSSGRAAPLFCPPVFKEDFECSNKPSFLNSRNGWFALSPVCCVLKPKLSAVSADSTALVIRGQPTETANTITPTYFSDLVALQIYRIVFLVLKFLCIEAEGAANRSAEVGYLDLSHFPELPMPEILHSLQDQAIAIVSELCNASKSSHVDPEIQSVCLLMLQITEMALYLEFCVQQICGIRPVLGRVEDFAKEFESLLKAIERHAFLKGLTKSLKQIVSLIYPGLSQTEGFI